tara:strand:- start:86816 stop:87094 length:279 start_codon:yes stop_codon:yes gene_type:complete
VKFFTLRRGGQQRRMTGGTCTLQPPGRMVLEGFFGSLLSDLFSAFCPECEKIRQQRPAKHCRFQIYREQLAAPTTDNGKDISPIARLAGLPM